MTCTRKKKHYFKCSSFQAQLNTALKRPCRYINGCIACTLEYHSQKLMRTLPFSDLTEGRGKSKWSYCVQVFVLLGYLIGFQFEKAPSYTNKILLLLIGWCIKVSFWFKILCWKLFYNMSSKIKPVFVLSPSVKQWVNINWKTISHY